uniref:Uncharacterized protein n=1 Tax=Steinernema glaseri TaxID=37863 RepID=A0A1I8A5B8_9BILA
MSFFVGRRSGQAAQAVRDRRHYRSICASAVDLVLVALPLHAASRALCRSAIHPAVPTVRFCGVRRRRPRSSHVASMTRRTMRSETEEERSVPTERVTRFAARSADPKTVCAKNRLSRMVCSRLESRLSGFGQSLLFTGRDETCFAVF